MTKKQLTNALIFRLGGEQMPFQFNDHQIDTLESLVIKHMTRDDLEAELANVELDIAETWGLDDAKVEQLQRYHMKLSQAIQSLDLTR